MNFGIIRGEAADEDGSRKKKLNTILIILIIGAIAFLAFSGFGGDEEEKTETVEDTSFDLSRYKQSLKEEAESALSQIKGAGEVKVVLSFDSTGKTVVAKNSQSKTQKNSGDDDRQTTEITDNVVVYGQGQSERPYVTEEIMPLPSGVLVIAGGADSEEVRYELYEAVKALYGISSHRIKVTSSENN